MADILTPEQRQQQNNEAEARRAAMASQVAALRAQQRQQEQTQTSDNEENGKSKKGKKEATPSSKQMSQGEALSERYGGTRSVYPDHNIGNLFGQMGVSFMLIFLDLFPALIKQCEKMRKGVLNKVGEPEQSAENQTINTASENFEQEEAESANRLSM